MYYTSYSIYYAVKQQQKQQVNLSLTTGLRQIEVLRAVGTKC